MGVDFPGKKSRRIEHDLITPGKTMTRFVAALELAELVFRWWVFLTHEKPKKILRDFSFCGVFSGGSRVEGRSRQYTTFCIDSLFVPTILRSDVGFCEMVETGKCPLSCRNVLVFEHLSGSENLV